MLSCVAAPWQAAVAAHKSAPNLRWLLITQQLQAQVFHEAHSDMHIHFAVVQVAALGSVPPPRYSHVLHVHNDVLYFFGGLNDLGVSTVTLFKTVLLRQAVDRACALANAAAFEGSPGSAGGDGQPGGSDIADGPGTAEACSAAAALQLVWQELEGDLPYNKSRATVLQQGQMRCYQLGSATLGRSINEDDAEKGELLLAAQLDLVVPGCGCIVCHISLHRCRQARVCILCRTQGWHTGTYTRLHRWMCSRPSRRLPQAVTQLAFCARPQPAARPAGCSMPHTVQASCLPASSATAQRSKGCWHMWQTSPGSLLSSTHTGATAGVVSQG